ncbi:MAG: class I SAM-dependent methyltransferase [Streptosporangiaceae bacterium]
MAVPSPEAVQAFAGRLLGIYTGSVLAKLIRIGYATGLLEATAKAPETSDRLAASLGLSERYVREWLGAMATGGILRYGPAARTYLLPPEHAALLTGAGARNLAPMATIIEHFGTHLPAVEDCFRDGGGVPYEAFRPQFTEAMDDLWRRIYDEQLVDGFLAAAPDVVTLMGAGGRVADIGCGTGHAINLMAAAFPASSFTGYDVAADAIARARGESLEMGNDNAAFEVLDVTRLPADPPFDLIFAFDAVHDQVDPATVLNRVHEALTPGGSFYMVDFKFSSDVAGNLENPFAPMYYGISLMHCMTVSLAEGGAGLGTVWGIEQAREMLSAAGFGQIEVLDSPRPQNCIFLCRK